MGARSVEDVDSSRRRGGFDHTIRTGLIAIVIGAVLGAAALWGVGRLSGTGPWSEHLDQQVVRSVNFDQKVTVMTLGIQGMREVDAGREILGVTIPGTAQTSYLVYSYDAALGFDGSKADIEQTADHAYTISVPAFEFLGHSNEDFKPAIIDGGALSFLTPDESEADAISEILNADMEQENINDSLDALKQQTETFYTNIIHAIDPDAVLTFEFADQTPAS